jgi:hypothetical protein
MVPEGCASVAAFTRYMTATVESFAFFRGAGLTDTRIECDLFEAEVSGTFFALPALPTG